MPEWQLTGGINWRPASGWQVTFETIYVAGQYPINDLNNIFDKNDFVVCNVQAAYRREWLTLFAAVNNLFDQLYETYPTSNGSTVRKFNPSPGFNVQGGVTLTF